MRWEHPSIHRLPPLHGRRVQPQLKRPTEFPGTRRLVTMYSLQESATVRIPSAGTLMIRKSLLRRRPNAWPDGSPARKRLSATSLCWTDTFRDKMELMTQQATRTIPESPFTSTSIPWQTQLPILTTRMLVPVRTLKQACRMRPKTQPFPKYVQRLPPSLPVTHATSSSLSVNPLQYN